MPIRLTRSLDRDDDPLGFVGSGFIVVFLISIRGLRVAGQLIVRATIERLE